MQLHLSHAPLVFQALLEVTAEGRGIGSALLFHGFCQLRGSGNDDGLPYSKA